MLRQQGYHVLEAASGQEASSIATKYPDEIHLLITDVVMPKMSGKELADRISESRPGMKILYISGYTADAIVHRGLLDSGIAFLQKPFTATSLVRKVREVLDAAD